MSIAKDKPEIEITPKMIEAGVDELWGFDREYDDPREVAVKIFLAMTRARFFRESTSS